MSRQTYTIKPFDWEGRYWVEEKSWGFCFCEIYDKDTLLCDDFEDGKAKAWADWLERILPALQPSPSSEE